jgi:hypothetical protein
LEQCELGETPQGGNERYDSDASDEELKAWVPKDEFLT